MQRLNCDDKEEHPAHHWRHLEWNETFECLGHRHEFFESLGFNTELDYARDCIKKLTDQNHILEKFRRIVVDMARCVHGRIQGDTCVGCRSQVSPSQEGRRIGTSLYGKPVVIPNRDEMHKPEAWYDNH